ncbi:hypothetical protein [Ruthenibacterium lactatiformans]|uniref:hypothetical protein n=1 Tax=Ruthenibacterium lactatiformans TaxID=1550024 RepID=UPI0039A25F4C
MQKYTVPSDGVHIRREDFSGKSADMFFKQWALSKDSEILLLLEKNRAKLEYRSHRLQHFAALCRKDTSHFYITHGDAGGNFFVSGDKAFLLDWDDVLLAPPERDAWVMGFRDWARCLFQRSLREQGIEYSLKPERLAYYSYYMFFSGLPGWSMRMQKSAFGWYGEKRIEYADDLWKKAWMDRGCLKEEGGACDVCKNTRSRLFVFYCSVNFALPGGEEDRPVFSFCVSSAPAQRIAAPPPVFAARKTGPKRPPRTPPARPASPRPASGIPLHSTNSRL